MTRVHTIAATLCCALLCGACGDDASTPVEGPTTDTGTSTSDVTVQPQDDATDDGTQDDGGVDSTGGADDVQVDVGQSDAEPDALPPTCPGQQGCECQGNVDCDNGFCIDTPAGKRCAFTCVDACDEAGFVCKLVNLGSSDKISICVPTFLKLCNPCQASTDCASLGVEDAVCVDQGVDGAFCGAPCAADDDCPKTYDCKPVKTVEGGSTKQCVRSPDAAAPDKPGICACNTEAVTKKLATPCKVSAKDPNTGGDVSCIGTRSCLPEGLSDCIAPPVTSEACDGADNDCDGVTDEAACDDDNPCTTDTCLPGDGSQSCKTELLDAVPCDADGNACTEGDLCAKGVCKPGKPKNCDDGNPCTKDFCDMAKGCTQTQDDGAPCDDENPCSIGDVCGSGSCQSGVAKSCNSPDPCLQAKCDAKNGKCKLFDAPEGMPCNDGTLCTVKDACKAGNCTGAVVNCDDANPCTNEGCTAKAGCSSTANANPCDDNNKCTQSDVCKGGNCAGLPVDITATCDDGNPCTTDLCKPASGCAHVSHKLACDDGNPCTKSDTCDAGKCVSGTNICACSNDSECAKQEDGDLCNGTLYCDKGAVPYLCKVNPKTVITCAKDKDGPCIRNTCASKTGKCAMQPINETKPCPGDGSVCTAGDACKGGQCVVGKTVDCDDKNPCTDDSCDAKSGCLHAANTAPCDADGNACTVSDTCKDKACLAGKAKVCDDKVACTKDSCDKASGKCTFATLNVPCDDGNACTTGDACGDDAKTGAAGCLPGKAKLCDDGNGCTDDSCDPKTGCKHAFNSAPCDADGDACTVGDGCKAGKCAVGPAKKCDDGSICTKNGCDKASGKCTALPLDVLCDDGNACTVGDKCGKDPKTGAHGCVSGKGKQCDDGNVCTKDGCDGKQGCSHVVDVKVTWPCYGGPDKTEGVGQCKAGKKTCQASGKLSTCEGAVLPAAKEVCDGLDDTCNGQTDEGCKAGGFRYALTPIQLSSSGGKIGLQGGGGRVVAGSASGGKLSVRWSLAAWLKGLVGGK